MYRTFDTVNGMPASIYRTPAEIKDDIRKISYAIKETSSMLNIRDLLVNILTSEFADKPERLIPELEEAISEARWALDSLNKLKEELDSLEDELQEVRWLFGR